MDAALQAIVFIGGMVLAVVAVSVAVAWTVTKVWLALLRWMRRKR